MLLFHMAGRKGSPTDILVFPHRHTLYGELEIFYIIFENSFSSIYYVGVTLARFFFYVYCMSDW